MTDAAPAAPAAPPAPEAGAGEKKGVASPEKPGEKTPSTSPPAEGNGKKRKYIVDGGEVEIDLSNEKAVDELIQRGLGAAKRFTEADKIRQQAEKWRRDSEMIVQLLRERPMALLEHAAKINGVDARKLVESWLYDNFVAPEAMNPEQKKVWEQQRELERLRDEKKKTEQTVAQKKWEEARAAHRANFERDIIAALEEGGLPKTSRTVARMATYMMQALQNKVRLTAKDVLPLVRQDYETDIRELFGPLNGELLAKLVGDENLKKIREFELTRLRGQGSVPHAPSVNGGGPPAPKEKKRLTMEEWKADLDRRIGR